MAAGGCSTTTFGEAGAWAISREHRGCRPCMHCTRCRQQREQADLHDEEDHEDAKARGGGGSRREHRSGYRTPEPSSPKVSCKNGACPLPPRPLADSAATAARSRQKSSLVGRVLFRRSKSRKASPSLPSSASRRRSPLPPLPAAAAPSLHGRAPARIPPPPLPSSTSRRRPLPLLRAAAAPSLHGRAPARILPPLLPSSVSRRRRSFPSRPGAGADPPAAAPFLRELPLPPPPFSASRRRRSFSSWLGAARGFAERAPAGVGFTPPLLPQSAAVAAAPPDAIVVAPPDAAASPQAQETRSCG
ncbi:hypothetical protein [Oryza sativa Japonica Group]|uniref:Uncharacterized protein n=1 Tax=Oryza sativa subsp. japonica TaxID=39947 RepID=Q5VQK5_ORYSJ|nr:hypothetical protein [Oryza sativa Japonica Group]BAD68280.1 hypothetical protein [Oryza sativa Japonica Group]